MINKYKLRTWMPEKGIFVYWGRIKNKWKDPDLNTTLKHLFYTTQRSIDICDVDNQDIYEGDYINITLSGLPFEYQIIKDKQMKRIFPYPYIRGVIEWDKEILIDIPQFGHMISIDHPFLDNAFDEHNDSIKVIGNIFENGINYLME